MPAALPSPLPAYRVMATIVGVLLIVLCLAGLPLHYGYLVLPDAMPKGGSAWQLGADISGYLGVAHGWLYMIFLITAFLLSRREKWSMEFTVVTMICGTIPILSFWAERRAVRRVAASVIRSGSPNSQDV